MPDERKKLLEEFPGLKMDGGVSVAISSNRPELLRLRFNEINDLNDERCGLIAALEYIMHLRDEWEVRTGILTAERDALQAKVDAAFSALTTDHFEEG